MGDAIALAVLVTGLTVLAVGLVTRGSRQEQQMKARSNAPWEVGSTPTDHGTVVFLYKAFEGSMVTRQTYGEVRRGPDHATDLLDMVAQAEEEVSMLNATNRH